MAKFSVRRDDPFDPAHLRAWLNRYPRRSLGTTHEAEQREIGRDDGLRDIRDKFASTDVEIAARRSRGASLVDASLLCAHQGIRRYLRGEISHWGDRADAPDHYTTGYYDAGRIKVFRDLLAWLKG